MKTSTFRRIMRFMKGSYASYIIGIIGISLMGFLFQTVIAFLFLNLFDTIADGTFEDVLNNIMSYMIYMVVIILIIPIFVYLANSAAVKTTGNIRKLTFQKLTKLPLSYYKKKHSANITSIVTNDIAETEKAYSEHLIHFLSSIIMGIGTLIVMFILSWQLALIPIFAGVITIIVNAIFSKRLRKVSKEVQEELAIVNTRLSNILAGINVIRIFNIQKLILNKFIKQNEKVLSKSNERVRKLALVNALNDLAFTIGFAGIVLVGSLLVLEGLITIGIIIAVVQLQNGVSELVRMLGTFIANLQTALASGERIFQMIDEEEEPKQYQDLSQVKTFDNLVVFKDVSFAYEDNQPVLNNLSLNIKKNQTVALVGPSGGGKSTVFKLLLQYYKINEGFVFIHNEQDEYSIQNLRAQLSYVPQDAYLFNASIKENIAYGKVDASDDEIVNAAKQANAHDFIMHLENGYDTLVGEQGAKLSGGQRQRIAIARAMLKDAPILLLDEATSALDNESERLIQSTLEQMMNSKTSLVIAHRLSTIEHADVILVISDGKVKEQGTHQSLLNIENGIYANLYQRQLRVKA
jgi:ATP-binding cassette, subfamily B, bacterial